MIEKIHANRIPELVAEEIANHMRKFSSFSSSSLAYYGVDMKFKIEFTLYARGEEKLTVEKVIKLGVDDAKLAEPSELTIEGAKTMGAKPAPKVSPNGEMPIGQMGLKPIDPDSKVDNAGVGALTSANTSGRA